MNTFKSLSAFLLTILCFSAFSQSGLEKFEFLVGTWQVENKKQFEHWEKGKQNQLIGTVYSLKDEKKIIKETLSLYEKGKEVIYQPIVLNQNNGQPVNFRLNSSHADGFSFENKEHDFPQKIQYNLINKNEIMIHVLGADNKGFSFKMIKK